MSDIIYLIELLVQLGDSDRVGGRKNDREKKKPTVRQTETERQTDRKREQGRETDGRGQTDRCREGERQIDREHRREG